MLTLPNMDNTLFYKCCGPGPILLGGRHDRGSMVVIITTCTTSAFPHERCGFEPQSWRGVLDTTLCDNVCHGLATGCWFSPGTPVSITNKTDRHDNCDIVESGAKHHKPNHIIVLGAVSSRG
jgi:hypothetical protein